MTARSEHPAPIKALTLWQPWAAIIAEGDKRIETRSWRTDYRWPLAIHAAKRPRWPDVAAVGWWQWSHNDSRETMWNNQTFENRVLEYGAVIAIAHLVDVVPTDLVYFDQTTDAPSDWIIIMSPGRTSVHAKGIERSLGDFTPGRFAWLLDGVRALEQPLPAKGARGLWDWTPEAVPA